MCQRLLTTLSRPAWLCMAFSSPDHAWLALQGKFFRIFGMLMLTQGLDGNLFCMDGKGHETASECLAAIAKLLTPGGWMSCMGLTYLSIADIMQKYLNLQPCNTAVYWYHQAHCTAWGRICSVFNLNSTPSSGDVVTAQDACASLPEQIGSAHTALMVLIQKHRRISWCA